VQELKIDHTFVSRIATSKTDLEIVRSITALAHTLGLSVTAEGVEYSEQLRLLEGLGCDKGQGYYLGEPMVAAELPDYLEDLDFEALLAGAPGEHVRPVPSTAPTGDPATVGDSGRSAWYHPAPLYNKQP
jgi:predicted signal transduction protein with EAL and GGDEF domain